MDRFEASQCERNKKVHRKYYWKVHEYEMFRENNRRNSWRHKPEQNVQ